MAYRYEWATACEDAGRAAFRSKGSAGVPEAAIAGMIAEGRSLGAWQAGQMQPIGTFPGDRQGWRTARMPFASATAEVAAIRAALGTQLGYEGLQLVFDAACNGGAVDLYSRSAAAVLNAGVTRWHGRHAPGYAAMPAGLTFGYIVLGIGITLPGRRYLTLRGAIAVRATPLTLSERPGQDWLVFRRNDGALVFGTYAAAEA